MKSTRYNTLRAAAREEQDSLDRWAAAHLSTLAELADVDPESLAFAAAITWRTAPRRHAALYGAALRALRAAFLVSRVEVIFGAGRPDTPTLLHASPVATAFRPQLPA